MKRVYLIIAFAALISASCSSNKKSDDTDNQEMAKASFVSERNIVDTIHLKKTDFNRQVITNGKLRALAKSILVFPVSGTVESIVVKNGEYVAKDGVIARLDPTQALNKLAQSRQSMERSELSFMNELIGYGYGRDTSKIPPEIVKVVRLKSGYNDALFNLKQAEDELEKTILKAPFAGKVANITAKPYESVSGQFCTLIDDRKFEVMFTLLESEVSYIKVGNTVKVALYSDPESVYNGIITQINPIVDEKGQIAVTAEISNNSGKLIEGMNVKVIAESIVKNRLVVPKGAVVMRDNFDVLFKIDKERNRAMWTYVKVEMSNSEYHTVIANKEKNAELNEGDIIIVSGNLNLAEGSNVEIKNR